MEHHLKIEGSKITLKQSYKIFYFLNKIKVIKNFKYRVTQLEFWIF